MWDLGPVPPVELTATQRYADQSSATMKLFLDAKASADTLLDLCVLHIKVNSKQQLVYMLLELEYKRSKLVSLPQNYQKNIICLRTIIIFCSLRFPKLLFFYPCPAQELSCFNHMSVSGLSCFLSLELSRIIII